ncbi:MAG: DUF1360 domain-containing protein [Acidobacteriota bacterium]
MQPTTQSQAERRPTVAVEYSPNEPMPLRGYAALLGIWTAGVTTFVALYADRLPRRIAWGDFVLMSIATHKLARIVTKDWVTSPLRAPFVRYQKSIGGGEVEEKARGEGFRRAVGDLVTCNWCIAPWIAAALGAGFVLSPRITRFVSTLFGAVAISDVLQHLYAAEKKLSRA